MMIIERRPRRCVRSDRGAALMTVIMVLALVGTLSLTLAVVSINNLVSARLGQQAGASLNAADAGISQAVTYLRENGVRSLNLCSPTCSGNPWGNRQNPATVTYPGKAGQSYRVWIEPIAKFPENRPGIYRIHSTGTAGGPAGRSVTVDAVINLVNFPLGIMTNTVIGGGNVGAHRISIFATGCVYQRSKIVFEGIDRAYGIPAAVHSSRTITDSQGSGRECPGTNKPIHDPSKPPAGRYCNTEGTPQNEYAYVYDQDALGGPLAGTPCADRARAQFPADPQFANPNHPAYQYPQTSKIDGDADLFTKFGIRRPPLTQSQLSYLRSVAVAQENYWTSATGWTLPDEDNAVVYFDLNSTNPGAVVDLNDFTPAWSRTIPLANGDSRCTSRSLLVIVEGGNGRLNANSTLAGSVLFISDDPYGNVSKANGTAQFAGTVYANNLDFTGTADMWLDECFMANIPPTLTDVTTYNYREVDR